MAIDVEKQTSEPNEETSDNAPLTIRIRRDEEEVPMNSLGLLPMCRICCSVVKFRLKAATIIFPCMMIYFGITNLHNCTISYFIPIYLVALGILLLSYEAILLYSHFKSENNEINILGRILGSIMLVWFIAGSVFVYKIYEPNYDPLVGVYCNRKFYQGAIWSVSILYAAGGLFALTYLCVYFCCVRNSEN